MPADGRTWPPGGVPPPRRPLPPRALLAAAVLGSLWLIGSGLWHTSAVLSSAYADLFCDAVRTLPEERHPWVTEAHSEYNGLAQRLHSIRQQSEALLAASNSSTSAVRLPAAWRLALPGNASGGDASAPFLFVGVLSVPHSSERRQAVRDTWMRDAGPEVAVRFVLYEEEATAEMLAEFEQFGDIVFVPGGAATDYRSIVYKTFALIEWVTQHSQPKFVLKTDDDAYVHTGNLVAALRKLCHGLECVNEKLYMGAEKRNGIVITEAGNKWSNMEYFELTGIREYAPYMFGGGYVFSADVARALHEANAIAPLKFMPNEDATFGFWVMGMDLRHVDAAKMRTAAGQCCFHLLPERDAGGRSRHARVRSYEALCAGWLVLHKVDGSDQMRYLHHRMEQCPEEDRMLARARQLAASQHQRSDGGDSLSPSSVVAGPASDIRPLQVYAMTNWRRGFHFFGRNDVEAWSADGSRLLRCRTAQLPHDMAPSDVLHVGYIPFSEGRPLTMEHSGWGWAEAAVTRAWSYRLGARAQWLGSSSGALVYNDRGPGCAANASSDELCAVVLDVDDAARGRRVLPRPVYALAPDGGMAASFCFKRLHVTEPGWGYAASAAALRAATERGHPSDDGIWLVDTRTGAAHLLVSLAQLFAATFTGDMSGAKDASTGLPYRPGLEGGGQAAAHCLGWVSAAVYSRDGKSLAFVYKVGHCRRQRTSTAAHVYTVDVDGGHLWRVPVVAGDSIHYGLDGRLLVCDHTGTYLVHNRKGVVRLQKPEAIANEGAGPCRLFGSGNRYVLGDTYHEPNKLYVWDLFKSEVYTLALLQPANWPGPAAARATLNPQWSPDGLVVALDSSFTWETGMQTYVVGAQHLQVALQAAVLPPLYVRHLYCDLAVRSGAAMLHFIQGQPDPGRWQVHAFQAGAGPGVPRRQAAALRRSAEAVARIAGNLTLHPEAAGTEDGGITINPHGSSKLDATMSEVQALVLPGSSSEKAPSWWRQHLGSCRGGRCLPSPEAAGAGSPGGSDVSSEMQAVDFSAWLAAAAAEQDLVVVCMDLGEGREFALLRKLLQDGSLALMDRMFVRWHYNPATWHEVALWEFVFSLLGIAFEYI